MIKDNKVINPFLGIAIGIFLIFFGIFGILFMFGDIIGAGLFMLFMIPFVLVGSGFLIVNSNYPRVRKQVRLIEKNLEKMNPMTYLNWNYAITKIKTVSDLYIIICYDSNYLNVLRMNEKTNVSVSWYRRMLGPILPPIGLLNCQVLTKFNGINIIKCEGEAVLYDIDENQWFLGKTTMFSIFFYPSQSMKPLLPMETLQKLINLIDQSN